MVSQHVGTLRRQLWYVRGKQNRKKTATCDEDKTLPDSYITVLSHKMMKFEVLVSPGTKINPSFQTLHSSRESANEEIFVKKILYRQHPFSSKLAGWRRTIRRSP